MDDLDVAYLARTIFEAGTDTTATALSTFVLVPVTHPDAYIKHSLTQPKAITLLLEVNPRFLTTRPYQATLPQANIFP
ncbi:hypothetical protein K439DRAFT_1637075 [Ramaria rubella]|nr:hypothetical protein K439DRAFT_1637075 [Ramaria rubella]